MSLKYENYRAVNYAIYLRHGNPHRVSGAALTISDGRITWYEYGQKHRAGGPAQIITSTHFTYYFIRGVEYTRVDYTKLDNSRLIC